MNQIKLKQAFIEGSIEQVEYSGWAENGFHISLKENDFLDLQPEQIVDILAIMAKYNPLLDDSIELKNGASRARFESWVEKESLVYFGRQLTSRDALLIRSVFGAEGVLTFGYAESGAFRVGDFPHADPVAALNECVGRICIYQEKGLFLRVKLARVTCENESVFLDLQVVSTPGFSSEFKTITVGASSGYMMIWNGRIENCMPGWTLVTGNAQVEHLTAFAATKPDTHAFIKEIRQY